MMEEVQIKTADLAVEDTTSVSSLTFVSKPTPAESIQKIYRHGDKIYQVKDENVTMIKDGQYTTKTSNVDSVEPSDEIASGESLYKTFTFDNEISPEETEKCLTFWRSIVEKNLEPIKCTIIENATRRKAETDQKKDRRKSSDENKRRLKAKTTSKDTQDSRMPSEQEQNVWYEILAELQKKRIHQTKLLMEKRCRFCSYVSSPPYETEKPQEEDRHFIKELAAWEPTSWRKKSLRMSRKSLLTPTQTTGSSRQSADSERIGYAEPTTTLTGIERILEESANEQLLASIKEESSKIKYIDAIQKKKELGVKVTDGKVVKEVGAKSEAEKKAKDIILPDPAVTKIVNSSDQAKTAVGKGIQRDDFRHIAGAVTEERGKLAKKVEEKQRDVISSIEEPTKLEKEGDKKTSEEQSYSRPGRPVQMTSFGPEPESFGGKQQEQDELFSGWQEAPSNDATVDETVSEDEYSDNVSQASETYSADRPPEIPRRSILVVREEVWSKSKEKLVKRRRKKESHKSLSVVLACACSNETCDCKALVTLPEKPVIAPDEDIPPPAPRVSRDSVRRVNSLELIKKRLSGSSISTSSSKPSAESVEPDDKDYNEWLAKVQLDRKPRGSALSVDSLELHRRRMSSKPSVSEEPDEDEGMPVRERTVSILL